MRWWSKRREDATLRDEKCIAEPPKRSYEDRETDRQRAQAIADAFNAEVALEVVAYEPPVTLKKAAKRIFMMLEGIPPIPIDAISDITVSKVSGPMRVYHHRYIDHYSTTGGYSTISINTVSGASYPIRVEWCKADILLLALRKAMMGEGRVEE